jgi:hypothetical protein
MSSLKTKIAGVATFAAAAASAALVLATSAHAVTTPSSAITNDPNASNGSLVFYDASGNVVTSGTDLSKIFTYAAATTPGRPAASKGTVYFAFPDHTQADSTNWNSQQVTASTTYPNASAPSPVSTFVTPVAKANAGDADLASLLPVSTQDHTAGYDGILQIRLYDTGPGASQQSNFWASDIFYDATAGTWQQVFPAGQITTSISAISPTPANPANQGTTSVALTATLTASNSSHPGGSVHLFDGATDLGAATFTAATGAISATATVADSGTYHYKFVYTPNAPVVGSSSAVLTYHVKGVAAATATALTGDTVGTVGDSLHYQAAVTSGGNALGTGDGAVQFQVNGANVNSPVALSPAGTASFNYPASGAGTIHVTSNFVPADPTVFVASSSNTVDTVISASSTTPDDQTFHVKVPQGTLVISTPYTVAHPFDLGTMVLNDQGTLYNATAHFGTNAAATTDPGSDPAAANYNVTNGVTITDTRAASTGWTASASTTDFTNPGLATVIPGDNLSFTGVTPKYLTGNHLQAGSVTTNNISGFGPVGGKKSFATTNQGPGTVAIYGDMNLTAPTSTLPGDYTATVTFTVA